MSVSAPTGVTHQRDIPHFDKAPQLLFDKYMYIPLEDCDRYHLVANAVLTISTPLIFVEATIRTLGMIFLSPMSCAGDKASKFYKKEFVHLTVKSVLTALMVVPSAPLMVGESLLWYAIDGVKALIKYFSKPAEDSSKTAGPEEAVWTGTVEPK